MDAGGKQTVGHGLGHHVGKIVFVQTLIQECLCLVQLGAHSPGICVGECPAQVVPQQACKVRHAGDQHGGVLDGRQVLLNELVEYRVGLGRIFQVRGRDPFALDVPKHRSVIGQQEVVQGLAITLKLAAVPGGRGIPFTVGVDGFEIQSGPFVFDKPDKLTPLVDLYVRCPAFQPHRLVAASDAQPVFQENLEIGPERLLIGLTFVKQIVQFLDIGSAGCCEIRHGFRSVWQPAYCRTAFIVRIQTARSLQSCP